MAFTSKGYSGIICTVWKYQDFLEWSWERIGSYHPPHPFSRALDSSRPFISANHRRTAEGVCLARGQTVLYKKLLVLTRPLFLGGKICPKQLHSPSPGSMLLFYVIVLRGLLANTVHSKSASSRLLCLRIVTQPD